MSNVQHIRSLEWQQPDNAPRNLFAEVEGGKLFIEYLPGRAEVRDGREYALYFIPDVQNEFLGIFTSIEEAVAAAKTWVGDDE